MNRFSFLFLTPHRDPISKVPPFLVPSPNQSLFILFPFHIPQTPQSHHPASRPPLPIPTFKQQPRPGSTGGGDSTDPLQSQKHAQLNHFIFLIIVSLSKAIYQLMSFPNFPHQLVLLPWVADVTMHCTPFLPYPMENTFHGLNLEPQKQSTSPSNQNPSPVLPWEIIESRLQQLHSSAHYHRKTHWTAQQDRLLSKLIEVQKLEWKQLPSHFSGRTQNMCYSRYRRISMASKDRAWSPAQEEAVLAMVLKLGEKWKQISSKIPKFTPKQIRERYLNYLRPEITKEGFSLEEDLKICRFVMEHGKHWRRLEEVLPGRAEGCIKGRYYGKLQRLMTRRKDETDS